MSSPNPKALARIEGEYKMLSGLKPEQISTVFEMWSAILYKDADGASAKDYADALETVKAARAAGDAVEALSETAKGFTATKALCGLVASIVAHVATFQGRTPRVLVSFDLEACKAALKDEGDAYKALKPLVSFSVAEGQAKRGRKATSGGVSSNSRISAWKAAQDAAKAGDTFAGRFKKDKDGSGYRDMGAGIGGLGRFIPAKKDGGLVTYIFALAKADASIAKSALVKKLAKYNADKAQEAGLTVEG